MHTQNNAKRLAIDTKSADSRPEGLGILLCLPLFSSPCYNPPILSLAFPDPAASCPNLKKGGGSCFSVRRVWQKNIYLVKYLSKMWSILGGLEQLVHGWLPAPGIPEWEACSPSNLQSPNRKIGFFISVLFCISLNCRKSKHILTYNIKIINAELGRRNIFPKIASIDKRGEPDSFFLAKLLIYYYFSFIVIQVLHEKLLSFVSDFHMRNLNNKFSDSHMTFSMC